MRLRRMSPGGGGEVEPSFLLNSVIIHVTDVILG